MAALRARIAAKDYEVRRLEAELGRSGGSPLLMSVGAGAVLMASGSSNSLGGAGAGAGGFPTAPTAPPSSLSLSSLPGGHHHLHRRDRSMDLLRQLQAHGEEARRLKAEYRALSGREYGIAAGSSATAAAAAATAASSSSPERTPAAPSVPASPPRDDSQQRRVPVSPRRLLQRHHSHQVATTTSSVSPPRRLLTYADGEQEHAQGGLGSPLASSAPARTTGPRRSASVEPQGEDRLSASSSSSRAMRGSGAAAAAAVVDPFKWPDGVPDHWARGPQQGRGEEAGLTGEAVAARLFVVLAFCALLFLTLSMRRLLPGGAGAGEQEL